MTEAASALRLAVGTLSIIPVGQISAPTRRSAALAMTLAPLAVLPLAVAAAVVSLLASAAELPWLLVGVLVVATLGLLTRGMHLDGLADTVDGLGASWDRERALTVMRQGDLGPMGAAALVVLLLIQSIGFGTIGSQPRGWLLVGVVVAASRWALALCCARGIPPARPSGLGAMVADSVPRPVVVTGGIIAAAALAAATTFAGLSAWAGPAALAAGALAVTGLLRRCVRALGGVTGDVMGASIELLSSMLLVVLAAGWMP